ncbi:MAG: hypothetical protein GWN13_23425, partial [Phycisphaerae bacterium]|nr:hypothetical protein [candidate division Zixibacteria bacterium]NIX01135.1 hypothetical protein [Phycisphaerae bacterium]
MKWKPREHFYIPDTQCRNGVALDHLTAAGNYIVDHKPDVIIHAGDHWDMPSLSEYDRGKKCFEGRRYNDDIQAGLEGMEALLRPLWEYNARRARLKEKQYKPRMVFTTGNHENRIERAIEVEPRLEGTLGLHHLQLDKFGWEVYPFLQPVEIDGVWYAHYFYNPMTGKPYGGKAHTRLNNIGFSFTMGHQQGKDTAEKHLANGQILRALIAGSFYQHDEDYKGPQGNAHW